MNRMLKCLSTPTASANANSFPFVDDAIRSVNRQLLFRHHFLSINERYSISKNHALRSSTSRLLSTNNHRRRSENKKLRPDSIFSRPVIILPRDFRSIDESFPNFQVATTSKANSIETEDVLFSSTTGTDVQKYPEGKPNWEKLQHICVRLADTWPKFFLMRMDYTIFHNDVILEDRIYGKVIRGVHEYMRYLGIVAAAGRIMYPQIEMHVTSLTPIIEDATVRMRWRVYYMNLYDWALMLARFKPFSAEYMKANGRMMDGYSIYHVDSSGAVYRHIIDQVIPDDEKGIAKGRLTLSQRVMAALGVSPAPKQPAPSPS